LVWLTTMRLFQITLGLADRWAPKLFGPSRAQSLHGESQPEKEANPNKPRSLA
jgi:hypothetical protein